MIAEWSAQDWVQRLGWTLAHFLWQGAAVAIAYAALRKVLGARLSAEGRYVLSCLTLGVMAAAPPLTFLLIPLAKTAVAAPAWLWEGTGGPPLLGGIVAAWSFGVAGCSLRLAMAYRFTVRLRAASYPAPPAWQQLLRQTARRAGASRPVRLWVSSLVDVPIVIGWIRPAIIVPGEALCALPLDQIAALLAHELAHIRRHDYFVNLLQGMVESLLFYHPAVWWVSRQIRTEREQCCDDLAIAAGGDVLGYARALAHLESRREPLSCAAPAATGGPLLSRVRRLIHPASAGFDAFPSPGATAVISLLCAAGFGLAVAHTAQANHEILAALRRMPQAILYDPFLPSPEVLHARYGQPHHALRNGPDLLRPVPDSLDRKYTRSHRKVAHANPLTLRQDAVVAPGPRYPAPLLAAGSGGLVVIEIVVSPAGSVQDSQILVSFASEASGAVTDALRFWRFHSEDELAEIFHPASYVRDTLRIGRLGFEFRPGRGRGEVVDLAAEEIRTRRWASPFLNAKRPR